MKNVRVLVANRPRLMRELILATVSDQDGIEIVGEVQNEQQIESAVAAVQPDFLIVALDRNDRVPDACITVLQKHPSLRVIAISAERGNTMFYWTSLNIQHTPIEASERGVLNVLRGWNQSVGS
jgi:AmiR/NasT family two-component response regulator